MLKVESSGSLTLSGTIDDASVPISGTSGRRTPGTQDRWLAGRQQCRSANQGFPVVIGEGSHPFPFRTRKLSSLPPMVLHG